MEPYKRIHMILDKFSVEDLDNIFKLLREYDKIREQRLANKTRMLNDKKIFEKLFNKHLEEGKPDYETPEELKIRKIEIRKYIEDNEL